MIGGGDLELWGFLRGRLLIPVRVGEGLLGASDVHVLFAELLASQLYLLLELFLFSILHKLTLVELVKLLLARHGLRARLNHR